MSTPGYVSSLPLGTYLRLPGLRPSSSLVCSLQPWPSASSPYFLYQVTRGVCLKQKSTSAILLLQCPSYPHCLQTMFKPPRICSLLVASPGPPPVTHSCPHPSIYTETLSCSTILGLCHYILFPGTSQTLFFLQIVLPVSTWQIPSIMG